MKKIAQYALALAAVALIAGGAIEASAQNRAKNTTTTNRGTTTTTTQSSSTKQSTTTKQSTSTPKPQSSVTTSSDRGSKGTTSAKPASSTPSKPSSTPSKPSSSPSKPSSSPSKPSGNVNTGSSHVGNTSDSHRGAPDNVKPSNKPSDKSGHKPDNKGYQPNKPNNHPGDHGYKDGHQPGDRPSGKYNGHYGGRPEPGHSYQEHKPKPQPAPSKPGHYRPVPYYHHGEHYYGHFIITPPHGLYSKRYNGIRYYYSNGVFYQRVNNYYRVCRPPYGFRIAWSKFGFQPQPVWFSPYAQFVYNDIYYADGVFYRLSGRYFYVIEPPVGAIVPYLPSDYYTVDMYGGTGYQVDNTIYQAVVLDGYLYYEVTANIQPRYY